MFIRKKKYGGRSYYFVVSNQRKDGKVKQKVEAYLGKHATIDAAIAGLEREIGMLQARRSELYRRYFGPKPPEVHRELDRSLRKQGAIKLRIAKLRALTARL